MMGVWRWSPLMAGGEEEGGLRLCSHQDEARGRQKGKDAAPSAEAGIIFVNWQALRGLPCVLGGEGCSEEKPSGAEQSLSGVRRLLQSSRPWTKLGARSPSGPTHRGGDTVGPSLPTEPQGVLASKQLPKPS